jgi:predicted ATPase
VTLFIEELTKAVIEAGADRLNPKSTVAGTALRDVPATLHASLMARFDRLGTAKEVAQVGAAIGREFSYDLLSAVSSLRDPDLQAAMNQLTASGLLFGRGSPPDASYLFKHALVQDVAYGTLLRDGRQKLHARIAEVLEERFPDRVIREPEVLAHHFAEAQQLGRAADYWLKAGRRAAERSANLEAIRHLTNALDLIARLPERRERDRQELALQIALGTPLIAVHGYAAPETGRAYDRARALCERLGDVDAPTALRPCTLFLTLSCTRSDILVWLIGFWVFRTRRDAGKRRHSNIYVNSTKPRRSLSQRSMQVLDWTSCC